jgi:hypothetical protein
VVFPCISDESSSSELELSSRFRGGLPGPPVYDEDAKISESAERQSGDRAKGKVCRTWIISGVGLRAGVPGNGATLGNPSTDPSLPGRGVPLGIGVICSASVTGLLIPSRLEYLDKAEGTSEFEYALVSCS